MRRKQAHSTDLDTSGQHDLALEQPDVEILLKELVRSQRELEYARQQFDYATDPALIDHVVFRIGAAERQVSFLLNFAREHHLATDGMHPLWLEQD